MRWRNVLLTACSALLLAGCGGDDPQAQDRTLAGPTIKRAVADQLATRTDTIANLIDGGDACGKEAARLRDELTRAINDGAIPELYIEDLSRLVNEIEAGIPVCGRRPRSSRWPNSLSSSTNRLRPARRAAAARAGGPPVVGVQAGRPAATSCRARPGARSARAGARRHARRIGPATRRVAA
jgi:hypothetical protein